ncbi:MAG: SSU ribosomal protein S1p [uncultured Thermomicrobiales bacterium]|uniref:SSU ribosomal protein S1p n=1 Tax=uncultured Thermomicrobiales bacterium TaxID=1645740 RepID=A0A6J4UT35_9BACT|nr:MAG: SSU ribosomal protein S1p [uncultured Thermomicrobiales bacterium]
MTLGMDESGYQEGSGDPVGEAPGVMAMVEERETGAVSATAAPVVVTNGTSDAVSVAEAPVEQSLMQQLLNDPSHDYRSLKYGDVLDGHVMQRDRDEFLIDIGSKSEGIIPSKEYSTLTPDEVAALKVGDQVLVFVVQPENQDGHTVLSIDKARQEKSWRVLQEQYDKNEVISAQVTNYNKGGLLVNLDGVRGFVPASQVTEIRGGDDAAKQADMARLVGSDLTLKVIEINRHRNRLILSERMAVQERRDAMKERLIENLKEGEVRKGRVSSIADFGAFVDIGGADGLVHLSEISWSRVKHPSEALKVGDEVDVYVLSVNPQEKKIALSIKRTQAEPWSRVASKYEIGQVVDATITQLANFGAFARIEDGIEGLIHVSELSDERVNHPREVVQEGQEVQVRIIRIDPQRRRMGLSLRRAADGAGALPAFGESGQGGGRAPSPVPQPRAEAPETTPAGTSAAGSGASEANGSGVGDANAADTPPNGGGTPSVEEALVASGEEPEGLAPGAADTNQEPTSALTASE